MRDDSAIHFLKYGVLSPFSCVCLYVTEINCRRISWKRKKEPEKAPSSQFVCER